MRHKIAILLLAIVVVACSGNSSSEPEVSPPETDNSVDLTILRDPTTNFANQPWIFGVEDQLESCEGMTITPVGVATFTLKVDPPKVTEGWEVGDYTVWWSDGVSSTSPDGEFLHRYTELPQGFADISVKIEGTYTYDGRPAGYATDIPYNFCAFDGGEPGDPDEILSPIQECSIDEVSTFVSDGILTIQGLSRSLAPESESPVFWLVDFGWDKMIRYGSPTEVIEYDFDVGLESTEVVVYYDDWGDETQELKEVARCEVALNLA